MLRTAHTTINLTLHGTHDYQSHSARPYKQRKTPTSEHSCVITLRTLILAPPRGDVVYCCRRDIRRLMTTIKHCHREELHLRAVVIPTWIYAILWRSSFIYTSALIRRSPNSAPQGTHDYQSHSARSYKQRKTPTSEHSGVITLRKLILAPPRGDDIYISFSYYFCMIFFQSPPEFTTEPLVAALNGLEVAIC